MIYKGWLNLSDPTYTDNNPLIRSYAVRPEWAVPSTRETLTTIRGLLHELGCAIEGTAAAGPVHDVTIVAVDLPIEKW